LSTTVLSSKDKHHPWLGLIISLVRFYSALAILWACFL
jgi:hypothetical protein